MQSAALATGLSGAASSLAAQGAGQPPGRGAQAGAPGRGPARESTLADLKGQVPQAQLGKLKLSRMIFGGNPVGGWAHSRDLSYVGRLMRAYYTDAKLSETLALAEKCGVNAILTAPSIIPKIQYHWKQGGKIQFISDCGGGVLLESVQKSIDSGAAACYIHGSVSERLVSQGDFDQMSKALELIRKNRLPAGVGAHDLDTIKAVVGKGISPDFWMKTFHKTDYWSAKVEPERDNTWCPVPEDVTAFMQGRKEPWIAFKTMAAGAIPPKDAFQFAFQNGADFVCAGMFDWQVVDNANTAVAVLAGVTKRERPWRA